MLIDDFNFGILMVILKKKKGYFNITIYFKICLQAAKQK